MHNFATAKLTQIKGVDLVGKTMKLVDDSSTNVLLIEFTDGESIAIESCYKYTYEINRMEEEL